MQKNLSCHVPQQVLYFCRLNKQSLKQSSTLLSQAAGAVTAGITVCGWDSCFSQSGYYLRLPHAQLNPTAGWQNTDFIYCCKILKHVLYTPAPSTLPSLYVQNYLLDAVLVYTLNTREFHARLIHTNEYKKPAEHYCIEKEILMFSLADQ